MERMVEDMLATPWIPYVSPGLRLDRRLQHLGRKKDEPLQLGCFSVRCGEATGKTPWENRQMLDFPHLH